MTRRARSASRIRRIPGTGSAGRVHRCQGIAGWDLGAVVWRLVSGEEAVEPGQGGRCPDGEGCDVAEGVVLGVVHRGAGVAEVARQGADVAGDHHPVAGPDAGLVARGAFESAAGALADKHGNGGRPAAAGIELILDLNQDGDTGWACVLWFDQLGEGKPWVGAQNVDDRGLLQRGVELAPVTAQVRRYVDVETPGDTDDGHGNDARPDAAAVDVGEIVGRVDEHAPFGRARATGAGAPARPATAKPTTAATAVTAALD